MFLCNHPTPTWRLPSSLSDLQWFWIELNLPSALTAWANMRQRIKDKHSVVTWSVVHCSSSFQQQQRPPAAEHSQQGVPAKEPDPTLKDTSHAQTKHFLVHLSFWGQFPLHRINESQLFLCSTIRNFIFGWRSITCKEALEEPDMCSGWSIIFFFCFFCFFLCILLYWLFGNK